MLEQILTDIQRGRSGWNVILLRYFNPIGAHKSGTMGENPNGIPNNLMPYVTQVAVGKLKNSVYSATIQPPDGTGLRDYIHVVDLAIGHVKALKKIEEKAGLCIYNLGTGHGYSVLDIVKNFEAATGVKIPYVIKARDRAILQPATVIRQGEERAWLGGTVRYPGDVRRFLEMAEEQSERIRRLRCEAADGAATRYCILNGIRFAMRILENM